MRQEFRVDSNWETINTKSIQIGPDKTIIIEHTSDLTFIRVESKGVIGRKYWLHNMTMEEIDAKLDNIIEAMLRDD